MHALHFVLVSPYCRRRGGEDLGEFERGQGAAVASAHAPLFLQGFAFVLFGGRGDTLIGGRLFLCL